MRRFAPLLAFLLAASCVGASNGSPSPSPSAAPRPFFTVIPAPSPTLPSPIPLSSAKGLIVVRQPLANSRVSSPLAVSGDASVFEAALSWRVTDTAGRVLAQGSATATAGAPARGAFSVTVFFTQPASDALGIVEVFDRSPRDGSIDEIVRVPVVLAGR